MYPFFCPLVYILHFKGHVMLFEFLIRIQRNFLKYLHLYNATGKRYSNFIISFLFI